MELCIRNKWISLRGSSEIKDVDDILKLLLQKMHRHFQMKNPDGIK